MSRRAFGSFVFAVGMVTAVVVYAESREDAAVAAANEWLALVDAGEFETSWQRSASLFRSAVSATDWEASVSAARRPFGAFVSRKVASAEFKTSLPGAPDGEYVVIQYRSTFEKKQAAVETVTPMREAGGWRVSGYYIK